MSSLLMHLGLIILVVICPSCCLILEIKTTTNLDDLNKLLKSSKFG